MNDEKVVAEIGSVYTLLWAGTASVASIVNAHGLKVGDKLIPQSAYAELAAERDSLRSAGLYTANRLAEAESQLAELRESVKVFLHPHLDAGTFGAPDWAIELYAILTGSTLAAADGG